MVKEQPVHLLHLDKDDVVIKKSEYENLLARQGVSFLEKIFVAEIGACFALLVALILVASRA